MRNGWRRSGQHRMGLSISLTHLQAIDTMLVEIGTEVLSGSIFGAATMFSE